MPDGSERVGQHEIEELLKQAKAAAPKPSPPAAGSPALDQAEVESLLARSAASPRTTSEPTLLGQGEIESLLSQAPPKAAPLGGAGAASREETLAQGDIEFLLNQAQEALASVDAPRNAGPLAGIAPFKLEEFAGTPATTEVATIELIRDVELNLKIELGRTQMYLEDVLKLRKGSVVPLDKLAGDPVDIYVNGRLIARGEVLVLNDNFCVRVAELVSGEPAK
jgi:flagellar motor switch protein FliN/FliY